MKYLVLALIVLVGCATTSESSCRKWQKEGKLMGTLSSCTQCVDTLGASNIETIRGCALGLDASKLLDPIGS